MNRFGTHFGRHFGRHFGIFGTTPPPPPPRPSGGYGPAGGGGGGGWDGEVYQFCEDDELAPGGRRRVRCVTPEEAETELEKDSTAATIAGAFGHGVAGYVGSKAITKAIEKRFGSHAAAAAAVGSVFATAAATDKLAEKSDKFRRLGTMVFGSVVAAVDDIVDIYVNERGSRPIVERVETPAQIIQRAQEASSLVVKRRIATRKNDEKVMILSYVSLQAKHTPPTLYVYQELVKQSPDGQFYTRGTLLELVRRARRGR